MNDFIKLLLSLSLSGTILIGLIVLFQRLLGDHFRKNWQYYIWLLVIARLLIPFSLDSSLMNQGFEQASSYVSAEAKDTNTRSNLPYTNKDASVNKDASTKEEAPTAKTTALSAGSVILSRGFVADPTIPLFVLWLVVAVFLFIRKVRTYCKFSKYLKEECTEITDLSRLELLGSTMERLSIRQPIRLYQNSNLTSPLLTGFFHCSIVLPDSNLPDNELSCIFLHELTHCKKKDMFYKWLVQFTICVHWFNPAIYLISDLIEHSCELACDESVIENLDVTEKKQYGDTLLHAAQVSISPQNTLAGVALLESGKKLKERLHSIMNFNKKTVFGICAMLVLTVLIVISAVQIGAYHKEKSLALSKESTMVASNSTSKDSSVINLNAKNGIQMNSANAEAASDTFSETSADTSSKKSSEDDGGHFYWNGTCYMMKNYYQAPYVFMIGWTDEKTSKTNSDTFVSLMMDDETIVPVYFLDKVKEGVTDTELLEALKTCLSNVRSLSSTQKEKTACAVIMYYEKIDSDLVAVAKDSYEKGNYRILEAICPYLSLEVQTEYMEKSYKDDESGVFSTFSDYIGKMALKNGASSKEQKIIDKYITASYNDDRIDIFCILEDFLTDSQKKDYMEKSYKQDRIDFFSLYTDVLDQKSIDDFAKRSIKDDRIDFFGCLLNRLSQKEKEDLAEKAYQQDRIDFFSCIISELDQTKQDEYFNRAKKDNRDDFYYCLGGDYCFEKDDDCE